MESQLIQKIFNSSKSKFEKDFFTRNHKEFEFQYISDIQGEKNILVASKNKPFPNSGVSTSPH